MVPTMALEWRLNDPDSTLSGQILVASRNLVDPNFFRTVVLILEHGDGTLGVVLNRPTAITIAEVVPTWLALAAQPAVVFQGGPVERSAAIGLARPVGQIDPQQKWFTLTISEPGSELGIVNLSAEPGDLDGVAHDLRIFSGYAGWSAGQLESEIQAGGWLVIDHSALGGAFDPLTSDPATLWNQASSAAASGQGVRAVDGPSVQNN
jgi:putative transcriptional regulator